MTLKKNAIHEAGFRVPRLLVNSISERKQQILQATFHSVRNADLKEEYRILMADSEESRRRTEMVLGLIQKALCGDMQPLIEDQIRTGYIRVGQKLSGGGTRKGGGRITGDAGRLAEGILEFLVEKNFIRPDPGGSCTRGNSGRTPSGTCGPG